MEVNIDDTEDQDGLEIPDIYYNIPLGERNEHDVDMKAPLGADLSKTPGAFMNTFMVKKMRHYDVAPEENKLKDAGITNVESAWQEYPNYWTYTNRHPNATVPCSNISMLHKVGPARGDLEGTR